MEGVIILLCPVVVSLTLTLVDSYSSSLFSPQAGLNNQSTDCAGQETYSPIGWDEEVGESPLKLDSLAQTVKTIWASLNYTWGW